MNKLEFFTVSRDTGSSYNSFTGHYSSLEKLLECFRKNNDLIDSYRYQVHNWLDNDTKPLNGAKDYEVSFEIVKEETLSGWGQDSYHTLKITVSNIKIQKGEYKVIPELKEVGKPYQPEQRVFQPITVECVSKEYKLQIVSDYILLDVVHLNYKKTTDLNGKEVE